MWSITLTKQPIRWIEIDVDQCNLNYGNTPCAAALGVTGELKCFNTFKTCQDRENYDLGSLTYKFYMAQSDMPREPGVFPCLKQVSASEGIVNIAGTNPEVKGLGRRERITFTCSDFPYGDQYTDKYADERKSGAAQSSGIGYDPYDRGLFFRKLRARWPYYAGRACRVNEAFIENGVVTDVVTSHYVLTDMGVDVSNDTATFEAKDVLSLADDDNAVAPKPNSGELLNDITSTATQLTLTPSGIGDVEYASSGRIVIGKEVMSFTRSGDVLTLTGRGLSNTVAEAHTNGDAVQETFSVDGVRVDEVIKSLLVDYAGVPSGFVPFMDWQSEADRWAGTMFLTADITKPTGVNKLISEISQIGISVWWDRRNQEVGFKVNRPPDEDTVFEFSDDANIKTISIDDRDDERLTQLIIYSGIRSPVENETDGNSYNRPRVVVDPSAQSANEFNDTKIRQMFVRWLGAGNESLIRIIGKRLLNRYRWSPSWYQFRVTYDGDLGLTDVIRVNSRINGDATGLNKEQLMQVIAIKHDKPKHEMLVTAQTYQFDRKYALIAPNSTPVYTSASDEEKAKYAFFADDTTKKLSDGSGAYVFS